MLKTLNPNATHVVTVEEEKHLPFEQRTHFVVKQMNLREVAHVQETLSNVSGESLRSSVKAIEECFQLIVKGIFNILDHESKPLDSASVIDSPLDYFDNKIIMEVINLAMSHSEVQEEEAKN